MKSMRINNLVLTTVVLLLGSVPAAWGAISVCPTSPTSQPLNATVAGPNGATNFGCSYIDADFDNFSVTAASGNGSGSFPGTSTFNTVLGSSNIDFTTTGTPVY